MQETIMQELCSSNRVLQGLEIKSARAVAGSSIHQAWKLELNDHRKIFAKIVPVKDTCKLKYELNGLEALRKFANPKVLLIPEPLGLEILSSVSILLIPWLNLKAGNQTNLGKGLALLHQTSSEEQQKCFGWDEDGYIGAGPQPGGRIENWAECFIELRLKPQLEIAKKWGLETGVIKKTLSVIKCKLEEHNPQKCLVHGDLWSGNCSTNSHNLGILIDPAVWWADREVDIAMTKLFGGFSDEFYRGYESIWPSSKSASKRLEIYNLYHLINHANIFGGSYIKQSLSSIKVLDND